MARKLSKPGPAALARPSTEKPASPAAQSPAALPGPSDGGSKPKQQRKRKPWRPDRPDMPDSAAELLALDRRGIEQLECAVRLRFAALKGRRIRLVGGNPEPDQAKLALLNAELAELGEVLSLLNQRRTSLRVAERHALGRTMERAEAIALAFDRIVSPPLHGVVMREAEKAMARSLRDMEAPTESCPD